MVWLSTILAVLSNVSRSGCFWAVLKQCGLILTQCGPEGRVILSECGPKTADVFGPGDLCSQAATSNIDIVANTPEVGEGKESLPVMYKGHEFSIAFNPEFLMAPLRNLSE
jgi:DNA polymerase III beta subunit-like protein